MNEWLLRIINKNYYCALQKVEKLQHLDVSEIQMIQNEKFGRLLQHCCTNVPYYKANSKFHHIQDISHIGHLPFLTKNIIRNNYNDLVAQNITKKRQRKNSTSGSSGEKLEFLTDNLTDVYRHAYAILGESWTGYNWGEKVVIIWGAVEDVKKAKRLKTMLANSKFLFNTKILSAFNLSRTDVQNYLKYIQLTKPSILIGYPSSLILFAEEISKNSNYSYRPKGIISAGEALSEDQRRTIQNAFNCSVLNRYGCRDIGQIAHECEYQDGLHIFSEHVIVEVINEKGEPCKPGELGEIVVTDLDNYVFPFIRYKIGDLGVFNQKKCLCGRPFPLLERVEGRTFDMIIGTNGNRVLGTFWSITFKHHIRGIRQFQVLQKEFGSLLIKLQVNQEWNVEEENKLKKLVSQKLGFELCIKIEYVQSFTTTSSGKFQWVKSDISPYL